MLVEPTHFDGGANVASELAAAAAHALPELPKLASPVPPFTPAETTVQAAGTSFACWGAEVRGTADGCVPDFEPGKGHFKNKCVPSEQPALTTTPCRHLPHIRPLTPPACCVAALHTHASLTPPALRAATDHTLVAHTARSPCRMALDAPPQILRALPRRRRGTCCSFACAED